MRPNLHLACLLAITACSNERDSGGGDPNPNPTPKSSSCGNNVLNGVEACDGQSFAQGRACSTYGLGAGDVRCNNTCTLNFTSCAIKDYCTANNLYNNGACDPCEMLGGVQDPECDTACSENGTCADRFDEFVGKWTCRHLNLTDPDCGTCGDGIIQGNEMCDQQAIQPGKHRCEDWGYMGGTLDCRPDCTMNFTGCSYSVCGDNTVEGNEQCEGTNFNGASCETKGFAGGALACTSSCTISLTGCIEPGCNNGIVEGNQGEQCDGSIGTDTCESLGFAGGTLGCGANCQFDTSQCIASGCGNNIIEAPTETCEGTNLNNATCESLGFLPGGTVVCSPSSCTYDTSGCVAPGCGNNVIESPAETCEGTNLNNATCESLNFLTGTLICDPVTCTFDTSGCVQAGCGNGVIEPATETCEGTNLNNATCETVGYPAGGTLLCNSCTFDASGCFGDRDLCGNGTIEGLEACDSGTFAAWVDTSCANNGYQIGTLGCSEYCRLTYDSCSPAENLCFQQGWYDDLYCDACHHYPNGYTDPDCSSRCGADQWCADYWNYGSGGYNCVFSGASHDPDCGCGNGVLEPPDAQTNMVVELCEGNQFANNMSTCADWGFTSGTLGCTSDCEPDFSNCF